MALERHTDALCQCVSRLHAAKSREDMVKAAKQGLVVLWKLLPEEDQRRFFAAASDGKFYPWKPITEWPEADAALRCLGRFADELDGPARDFARDLLKRKRSIEMGERKLTAKQAQWLVQLYREWKRYADAPSEVLEDMYADNEGGP